MTVKEFVQGVILIIFLLATGIVLPIGVVAVSASHEAGTTVAATGPVFVFDEAR